MKSRTRVPRFVEVRNCEECPFVVHQPGEGWACDHPKWYGEPTLLTQGGARKGYLRQTSVADFCPLPELKTR